MDYDNVIQQIGSFGRHQRRIFLVLSLPAISWAFHKMGGVFLSAKPDFRCSLPNEDPQDSDYQLPPNIPNSTYPWDIKTEDWPRCEGYNIDSPYPYNSSVKNFSGMNPLAKCNSFVYDRSQYTLTTTTEWDLVCDDAWLSTTSNSLFMLGDLPGGLILSGLSDRYGRKRVLVLGTTVQFVCGVLVALSPEVITFTILRFLVGVTITGTYLIAYVFAIEMVSPKNRMIAGAGINLSYITGYILIAGLAYAIPNWRALQVAFTIPSLTFLLFSRSLPESGRWLLTKGRAKEAKDILQKASLENGVELAQDSLDSLSKENSESRPVREKSSPFDILRYRYLRNKSLLLFLIWFVIALTYYGLSWNTSNLGGNDYINFLIAAAVEVPAQVFVLFTINRWGRRLILCSGMCLSGISLLLTFFVPIGTSWLMILLAMMGKSTIAVAYATVFVFTSEQYPTPIRNVAVGACSAFARLGAVVAPFITHLFEISAYVPLVMLGSAALLFGLLSLLLPETLNEKLPESVQRGAQFEKGEQGIEQLDDADIMKPTEE